MTNTNVPQERCNQCKLEGSNGICDRKDCSNHVSNVPQWEEDLEKVDIAQDWGMASSYLYDYLDMDKLKAFIHQAIQEERQRIVGMIEKKYSDHGAYEEWNVVREIINLIHKE